jgi:hypothetical protein
MVRKIFAAFLIVTGAAIVFGPYTGCKKDGVPVEPPPDTSAAVDVYGSGSLEFDADSAGGHFSTDGKYKPSSQFGSDSSSQGAGGFLADTTVFFNNVSAAFTAYTHELASSVLEERLIVLAVHDTTGILRIGVYPFSRMNTPSTRQAAYLYFFFSDSLNFYKIFIPKNGNLFITSFDPSKKTAAGTFSGFLFGQGDTLTGTHIVNGRFSLQLAAHYFAP